MPFGVRDGKLIKAAGYGTAKLELNVPTTKDSIFEIGSISKQFCAEAVMMLDHVPGVAIAIRCAA